MNLNKILIKVIFFAIFLLAAFVGIYYYSINSIERPIKVGIIHSLSGEMASTEEAIMEATLLAIDEINKSGGLLNRIIEPITLDGKSDNKTFAKQAEYLIKNEKVDIIFGGLTPSSRKSLKAVVEKYDKLLFFPGFNEGLEESPNIFYTGAAPNQYLIPAISWAENNIGNKFYLLGSNNYFSKITIEFLKTILPNMGCEIVGQETVESYQKDFSPIITNIEKSNAQIVLNILNLDSSLILFKDIKNLKEQKKLAIISIGLTQNELSFASDIDNTYLAGNYFESIDTKESDNFKKRIKDKYGKDQEVNDFIESAYNGVQFWKQAVKKANSTNVKKITTTLINSKLELAAGLITIDTNHYTYKTPRILKLTSPNPEIIWQSNSPLKPIIYPEELIIEKFNPLQKTKQEWNKISEELYNQGTK
ncbi:MAG: transporter substrate-binding protein [Candidatus Babeliales bacterium]|nr:transporter substrate-binding protein [Candidatus Babeliales bacterium]